MKKNLIPTLLLCSFLIFILHAAGFSQNKTDQPKRLVILPARIDSAKTFSINDEVVKQITEAATESFRYFVFYRWNIM